MDNTAHNSLVRLPGFAAARIRGRRLSPASTQAGGRVRARVCAELVLRPVKETTNPRAQRMLPLDAETRPVAADSRHAA
ncbi:MAG: hypothetical protein LBM92_02780 [Opitutaceae bacterium]|jgi:hypothetical protein|nr:hypothetical protein [Opitutaceae bacterium]